MHLDLWSPGNITYATGKQGYLMNGVCDLTQFVVSCPTSNITAVSLAELFMSDIVLTFLMCSVVVVDDGSTFKGAFIDTCKALNIHYWCLSRGNHKGNSMKRYHRFLNKPQTIASNDRGTHSVYIKNANTSQYLWNSAHIEDTNVTRCMTAIGRDFRFHLDVNLMPTSTLNNTDNANLFQYLRDMSTESAFALLIMQIIVEERR